MEGELDRKLMIMNGENPVSRRLTGHIVPSMKNAVIIKDFYRGITAKEVKKHMNGMVFYSQDLVCPSKIKRMALYAALKVGKGLLLCIFAWVFNLSKYLRMDSAENR